MFRNLEWNSVPGTDFVLLDYSSTDDLAGWVHAELQRFIDAGVVAFYQMSGCENYVSAHAKNVAHRLAAGDIVCNLDADNFTGPGFAGYLAEMFESGEKIVVRGPTEKSDNCGRVAIRRRDFLELGGYDERFVHGWGHEDWDLIARAEQRGFSIISIPLISPYLGAIPHSDEERTQFNPDKDIMCSNEKHRAMSEESLQAGQLVANTGRSWGSGEVLKNFAEKIVI